MQNYFSKRKCCYWEIGSLLVCQWCHLWTDIINQAPVVINSSDWSLVARGHDNWGLIHNGSQKWYSLDILEAPEKDISPQDEQMHLTRGSSSSMSSRTQSWRTSTGPKNTQSDSQCTGAAEESDKEFWKTWMGAAVCGAARFTNMDWATATLFSLVLNEGKEGQKKMKEPWFPS